MHISSGYRGRGLGPPALELDVLVIVLASSPEPVSDSPGVADEPCGFPGWSTLVTAGSDLGSEPRLALIGISDLYSGIPQQIFHLRILPRLG